MNTMTATTDEHILKVVRQHLEKHQPSDYHLNVADDAVRHVGSWWYVVVQPDSNDVRASDYERRLEATEEDIEHDEHLRILLVPVLPD
jgi:hypothetical protein